ncbi:hypothetical protein HG537_0E00260 [Torulaspora globosa]|uniref:TPR-like protein n=1 Tax=Torulaspora globosa TaxID=48254 RepID=A0A7H9HTW2_9SACH|nr:hypothetical protein HG537_0E00260 [Torulaspora sp. CBS 2947]
MESTNSGSYPPMEWPTSLDIPLKASEEVVSIDLKTDLPDDPADLKTLLVEEGSDKEHWLTIAVAYCNQGKTSEGIRLAEMALEALENSENGSLHTFLTWAHLKMAKEHLYDADVKERELTEAEVHLKSAIGLDPTWIGNMLATIDLYYQRGHYDRALETCDLFVKSIYAEDRRTGRTSKQNAFFLLLRAKLLYQKKNYVASLKNFQELLVINPVMQPDPRIGIGLCFWQLKDYKIAISAWKRALELDPNNENAAILVLLGDFHTSLTTSETDAAFKESYSKVLSDLNNLFSKDKQNPVLLTLLEIYFFLKGDYAKVIDIYESNIKEKSSLLTSTVLSEALFWCGRAYYAQQDYRKAFSMYQQCLKLNEDNLLAKFGVGQTQIKNKLVEESIITFENLFKSFENIQELNYILGLLYASKHFSKGGSKGSSGSEEMALNEKAIQYLTKYIKLTSSKKNQIVVPRAYLVISQLYEDQNNYKQSLEYLSKAYEELMALGSTVPLEILNNLGCFNFINGDLATALQYFEEAKKKFKEGSDMTISYNIARTLESTDESESKNLYNQILSQHPGYVDAQIRSLFLQLSDKDADTSAIEDTVRKFYKANESNLEVRSFYSWFLKKCKKDKKNDNLETAHNKETLVKYDSHDVYALISLGNLYCIIGRGERKSPKPKDQENAKQSFLKAVQLFQKVLQVDPYNVFAAQGIAIVFAENKRIGPALEILRKIRDSLDNEDIHCNIANCLLEMHENAKAIETYEYTLKRFGNPENKPRLLNLLSKAWFSRGVREKSFEFLKKALSNAEMAIELEEQNPSGKFTAMLKYNAALLHFQIAETLRRAPPKQRKLVQITEAITGLQTGLKILKELQASKEFNIIPEEELEQRIQLGETTMKSSLERIIKEQKEFEEEQDRKLEEARKILEENEVEKQRKKEEEEQAHRLKLEKQKEEYRKLQDEAQRLIQEREAMLVAEDEKDQLSDELPEGADHANGKKSTKKRKSKKRTEGEPKKRRKKQEAERSTETPDLIDEDDETVKSIGRKAKKAALSNEFIEDSDNSDEADAEPRSAAATDDEEDDLF